MRTATERDLWKGQLVVYWVQKPFSFVGDNPVPQSVLDEVCRILQKELGGKFEASIVPDTKEVVQAA